MAQTIYERAGGFATVRKIVSDFYDKVLDSPRLQRHFEGIDMRVLIDHQTKFIASVMGGPAAFSDDALERVHKHLGITQQDFAEMTELLRETLEDFDLAESDVDEVCRQITKRERVIVSRHG